MRVDEACLGRPRINGAGVRRLPPFRRVATSYLRQATNPKILALPTALSGFRLTHFRWPDAQTKRIPRAKRTRHQHSELLKSLGFATLQNAKNPGSAFWAPTGVSGNPREVPSVVQVTSRKSVWWRLPHANPFPDLWTVIGCGLGKLPISWVCIEHIMTVKQTVTAGLQAGYACAQSVNVLFA